MQRIKPRQTRKQAKQRKLRMEPLEHRLCLAASLGWDGPGLGSASLTYYIGNVPANVGLEQVEVETAIETALDAWSQVADVTFAQTTLARQSDSLDITFSSIDGSGGILAQAYLPDDVNRGRLAGDIEFDLADPWEIGSSRGSSAFDLVYVAAHEIGHALGLDHLNVASSVMRPSVSPSQAFTTLSTADMDAILGLYAAAPSVTSGSGNADAGNTDAGNTDTGGGNGTTDQGGDTSDDDSSSDDNTSSNDELPRRRGGGWRGRFGGFGRWRGRIGRATIEVLRAAPSHHNSERPADVNNDRTVSAIDALMVVNDLNKHGPHSLSFGESEADGSFAMLDVSGDEKVTALDALMVINELNGEKPVVIAIEEPVDEAEEESDADDASGGGGTGTEANDENDEQSEDESVDDTMVDDGPLEEEHEGCHRRHRAPFERFDANEDGLLTMDEVPATIWERLLVADTDEDGAISPAELEAIAHEHHRGDPFAAFDANQDGALTVDEVPQRLWTRLSQADANKDGAVTADELAQLPSPSMEVHAHRGRRSELHDGRHQR